jgi:hypothetical protein
MKETEDEKLKRILHFKMTLILDISCQQRIFNFSSITMKVTEMIRIIHVVGHYTAFNPSF